MCSYHITVGINYTHYITIFRCEYTCVSATAREKKMMNNTKLNDVSDNANNHLKLL